MSVVTREDGTTAGARIHGLIFEACLLLNEEDWNGFLDLCDPERFRYVIGNHSPEIRRDQFWMDRGHSELRRLTELLPKHNSDHAKLTRQVNVYRVQRTEEKDVFSVTSLVTIYRTEVDGLNSAVESGLTSLYVVGKYLDRVSVESGTPRFIARTVWLDTRQVGTGSHYLL